MFFRQLDLKVFVADSPLRPQDMADAVAREMTLVINNRPDGEAEDQFDSETLREAAEAAGLSYLHIPIAQEFSGSKVEALLEAMLAAEGQVLLACASGTRSTYLWALARARQGMMVEGLAGAAARAGYNIGPILPWLRPREAPPG